MIEPRIDDLLEHVDSRYALVIVAAKRARQINSYHHQLGEGIGFDAAPPPLIESRSKNYLTMAMEEVAQAKIAYAYPKPKRWASSFRPVTADMAMARIVLGITGGIAAYKACEVIRLSSVRGMTSAPANAGSRAFRRSRDVLRARSHDRPGRSVSAPPARRPTRHRQLAMAMAMLPCSVDASSTYCWSPTIAGGRGEAHGGPVR